MATKFLLAIAALAAIVAGVVHHAPRPAAPEAGLDGDELELIGNAGRARDSLKPKVTAFFTKESYSPGDTATLVVTDTAPRLTVRIYRAGEERRVSFAHDVMRGAPVGPVVRVGAVAGRRRIELTLGPWPSGVYFARLSAPGSRVGFAPFVLRPARLGEHRVALVLPTESWQAYNFRDDDGDGHPDTWYAGWKTNTARLHRAFLDRGVPPHWEKYDAPFVRWIVQKHPEVDFLSDAELRSVVAGDRLAKAYDLIVFSGHHEYVTEHEYDVVERYRNLGGNLAFLAANNFFWKITIAKGVMTRVAQWRDLDRPEAALIGVQYRANDRGGHRGPWQLTAAAESSRLFVNTGLEPGDGVGTGGIEIDATTDDSPNGVQVLAQIPNLYGPGFTAQMTYYETAAGAKVFAAGAFSLARSVWDPGIDRIVANVWAKLSNP